MGHLVFILICNKSECDNSNLNLSYSLSFHLGWWMLWKLISEKREAADRVRSCYKQHSYGDKSSLGHPKRNKSWIFPGRTDAEAETPILGPPDAKNWLIWKDHGAGKDWRWEEKGMTEDEMAGWHQQLNGHEFE